MDPGAGVDIIARHEAICIRAYAIWEHEGRPNGKDWAHWFQAESEIAEPKVGPRKQMHKKQGKKAAPARKDKTKTRKPSGRKKRKL